VLAATRRLIRSSRATPVGTIRSLAYFLPVIEEVREMRISPDYTSNVSGTSSNAPRHHGERASRRG